MVLPGTLRGREESISELLPHGSPAKSLHARRYDNYEPFFLDNRLQRSLDHLFGGSLSNI